MRKEIILIDGPNGTPLWEKADAKGIRREPVWKYSIEHPELVEELDREYIEAGSRMILANTFAANGPAVKRSSDYTAPQVVKASVELTKRVLLGTGIPTGLAVGPLTQLLEPYGDLEEDECRQIYEEMIGAGMDAGAEYIYVQTFLDLSMMKIAAKEALKYRVPVFCSLTFEKHGRTMMGNSVEDFVREIGPLGPAGLGMNCSLGPDMCLPILKEMSEKTDLPLMYKPNAGLPVSAGGGGTFMSPEDYAKGIEPALEYVTYVGGCCGAGPEYIRELKKMIDRR